MENSREVETKQGLAKLDLMSAYERKCTPKGERKRSAKRWAFDGFWDWEDCAPLADYRSQPPPKTQKPLTLDDVNGDPKFKYPKDALVAQDKKIPNRRVPVTCTITSASAPQLQSSTAPFYKPVIQYGDAILSVIDHSRFSL